MSVIIRKPSAEEQEGPNAFKDIMTPQPNNIVKEFTGRVAVAEREHQLQIKPYCQRCAHIDFKKWLKGLGDEMEYNLGFKDFKKLMTQLPDVSIYGEADRFELIKDRDAMEPTRDVTTGGLARSVKIGVHRDYKCKVNGCGIAIFIPNDKIKEMSSLQQPEVKAN